VYSERVAEEMVVEIVEPEERKERGKDEELRGKENKNNRISSFPKPLSRSPIAP